VKSLDKSGGNGVRLVKESLDYSNFESKPDGWISFSDLFSMLGDKSYELLITEYFPGKEYSVDVLADKGRMVVCVPRTRDVIRSGITFEGETVKHEAIIETCKFLTWELNLDGAVGFQFKENSEGNPMLLECNPRVQGTMVHSTLANANVIRGAVEQTLFHTTDVSQNNVRWGVKIRRYWGCSVQ
jgi:carbamoyl-phosphate synthase large subunit